MAKAQNPPEPKLVGLVVVGWREPIGLDRPMFDPTRPSDNKGMSVESITHPSPNVYRVERKDGSCVELTNCPVVALYDLEREHLALFPAEIREVVRLRRIAKNGRIGDVRQAEIDAFMARAAEFGQVEEIDAQIEPAPPTAEATEEAPYVDAKGNAMNPADVEQAIPGTEGPPEAFMNAESRIVRDAMMAGRR